MKLAHIVSVPNSFLLGYSSYFMALTHLIEQGDSEYISTFKELARRPDNIVILDNSIIELKETLNLDQLIKAAELIGAHEIIIPDTLKDAEKTLKTLRECIPEIPTKYNIFAVPQGRNYGEWISCYDEIANIPRVHTIGIPKLIDEWSMEYQTNSNRTRVLQTMNRRKSTRKDKPHHLLGLNHISDLSVAKDYTWIRGCDTCVAFLATTYHYDFFKDTGIECDSLIKNNKLRKESWFMDFTANLSIPGQFLFVQNAIYLCYKGGIIT